MDPSETTPRTANGAFNGSNDCPMVDGGAAVDVLAESEYRHFIALRKANWHHGQQDNNDDGAN
jgi:hypothetical protein